MYLLQFFKIFMARSVAWCLFIFYIGDSTKLKVNFIRDTLCTILYNVYNYYNKEKLLL